MMLFVFPRLLPVRSPTRRGLPPRSGRWRRGRSRLALALVCLAWGCKREPGGEPSAKTEPPLGVEPERFSFVVPSEYVPLQLRGEGSETLRAPPGARVSKTENGFSIDAGPEFALDISLQPPSLAQYRSSIEAERRVFEADDVVIFKSAAGQAFLALRELVPEWDESDRQRFGCGSRGASLGAAPTRADTVGFSRSAVQNMVAACRSLDLPSLE